MSAKAIVLIVEDDKELQRNLADQLSLYEDFSAIVADLGTDALSLIDRHHVELSCWMSACRIWTGAKRAA